MIRAAVPANARSLLPLSRLLTWMPLVGERTAPRYVPAARLPVCRLGYAAALQSARDALRAGDLARAEDELMRAGHLAGNDPAFFTLVGVLHECRSRPRDARKSYGRAIASDGHFPAAQQNMRRLYELATFGRAVEPIALGDEPDGDGPR